ncbi:MAG: hypothetical protein Q7Q71_09675 [Verrucomicrobiota bacterium JB023]|nr:hypothetical protein [Verrucomicrobiota bacterium JB023]
MKGDTPRILIVTAGYGDGHNSAARGLARALYGMAEVRVIDPCADGAPIMNNTLRGGYRMLTVRSPFLWNMVYRATERRDFSKEKFEFMRRPEIALQQQVEEFQPDAIVSTYPLYPYFIDRLVRRGQWKGKVFTIVTDSIEINNAWLQAPTDYWLVTDSHTRREMLAHGLPPEKIVETGFPVSPVFESLPPLTSRSPVSPFRVLFFATARKPQLDAVARPVLEQEQTTLTLILGRNFRRLYPSARQLKAEFPGRVRIFGWARQIPRHLCTHHLAIGKAGGATTHECLAASTPMLIHHLVPGQEEGNLELLRRIGGGDLADTPDSLKESLGSLLADNCAEWKRWKKNLARHSRPHSASITAQYILKHLDNSP